MPLPDIKATAFLMDEKKLFGAYIRKKRLEAGLTQKELAGRLYVTESSGHKGYSVSGPAADAAVVIEGSGLSGGDFPAQLGVHPGQHGGRLLPLHQGDYSGPSGGGTWPFVQDLQEVFLMDEKKLFGAYIRKKRLEAGKELVLRYAQLPADSRNQGDVRVR